MVNEIGDIAIDNELIIGAGDDMVELGNGCICCSINNDLVDAIFRVLRSEPPVEYLIVETTGLADPLPIVLTFLRSEFRDARPRRFDRRGRRCRKLQPRSVRQQSRRQPIALCRFRAAEQMRPRRPRQAAAAIEEKIRAIAKGRELSAPPGPNSRCR